MTINLHQIKYYLKHYFTAKRSGHGVHSPFAYQLCENIFHHQDKFYDFEELKKIRTQLLNNKTEIIVEDFGAGSKTFNSNKRKIKDIAAKGISTTKQSETLYKLINFLNCKTIIELGTSLGLNTLYLAKAAKSSKVISIEGSKTLTDFAEELAKKNNITNIHFVNAKFDEALPTLLQKDLPDLFYVDGNHTYEATLHYFNLALERKGNSSVFIFDDIYWSHGMTKAWEEIKKNSSVTLTIDLFYFGIVFFKEEVKEKVDLKLFL
ncbi:MAG: class I SAM-dependent methyltransferase [Bacteroidetes bacterium]|nr:class I SAM-dependent methyltransferase [Bacteroidota bacterium]